MFFCVEMWGLMWIQEDATFAARLVRLLNRFTRVQCLLHDSEMWEGLSEIVCVLSIWHNYRC